MAKYSVIIAPIARKQIDKLHPATMSRVANALAALADDPFIGKALKWDLKGLHSYRVGDYRIIYHILKKVLVIEIRAPFNRVG